MIIIIIVIIVMFFLKIIIIMYWHGFGNVIMQKACYFVIALGTSCA